MTALLRSEWIKFRSVRSTVVTLVLAGALVVLVAVLSANSADSATTTTCVTATSSPEAPPSVDEPDDGGVCGPGSQLVEVSQSTNLSALAGGVTLATLLFGVLGVQVIGQEYRFNTIRPTFTAAPRRIPVLAAKVVVVAVASAVTAGAMMLACLLVGQVMVEDFVVDGTDQRIIWATVLFAALWSTACVGIGAIVRQPIAGILVAIGYSLVGENIIGLVFSSTQKWLPFANGVQMTLRLDDTGDLLSPLAGGIYFAVVCAVLVVVGAVLVDRRDA